MTKGQELHNQLKGKYIIRPESHGELYYVDTNNLEFCSIYISRPELKNDFNKLLLGFKDNFVGISEDNFKELSDYIISSGGTIGKWIDIEQLLKDNLTHN